MHVIVLVAKAMPISKAVKLFLSWNLFFTWSKGDHWQINNNNKFKRQLYVVNGVNAFIRTMKKLKLTLILPREIVNQQQKPSSSCFPSV